MSVIGSYKNGDYNVVMLSDGSKIRFNDKDSFTPVAPESIDLKVTNKCFHNCVQCHENSTVNGKHGDIMNLSFLDTMLPYSEVAIGGGNVLLHPDLIPFLKSLKERKLIANMTVNQIDFMKNIDLMKSLVNSKLIYGLGVSLTDASDEFIAAIKEFPNAVIHIINGLIDMETLYKLAFNDLKVLILGYKEFRRGETLYHENKPHIDMLKSQFYAMLPTIIDGEWFECVSFDNLAIKQLNPKRFMSEDKWSEFYMGDDGFATMYIDAVERKFTKSSTSTERFEITDDIKDMFNVVRNM